MLDILIGVASFWALLFWFTSGTFIVARLCKVRVDVFSIASAALFCWKRGATDCASAPYRLAVRRMAGQDLSDVIPTMWLPPAHPTN